MIVIDDKTKCAGCTACAAICPRDAIQMICDQEGFRYPCVDTALCVDCGLCDKVCALNKAPQPVAQQQAYAVKHTDKGILQNSTSGGAFTALSDLVLEAEGVVYGAVLGEDLVVRHKRAATKEARDAMRGSKYVQSDLGDVFRLVKKDLQDKKKVLFTGTPCQVSGLKSFLGDKQEGLLCCDLICHGVPSPLIFGEHMGYLQKKLGRPIAEYRFRDKKWGWHVHREMAVVRNGKQYYSTPETDMWRNIYYSRIVTRPSCAACPYSNLDRCGDITIGDCRGIDKVHPDFGSDEGVSLVIVNTPVGQEAMEKIKPVCKYEALDIETVMQPPLHTASPANKSYEKFFANYHRNGYAAAVKLLFGKHYRLKYYIKRLLGKNV